MSDNLTRQAIFSAASKKMRADFEELRIVPHNATKGAEAEKVLRTFLNGVLPKRFSAGAGFIIDPTDAVSPQTDVVIYDALNCPVYRASDEASIFPSTNVAAVIEVKSTLDKQSLGDAAEKIARIKSLKKYRAPSIPLVLVREQTLGCVFAFSTKLSWETLLEHYEEVTERHSFGGHIDVIAILDEYVLSLAVHLPDMPGWNPIIIEDANGLPHLEGAHIGVGASDTKEETLDHFIRLLLPNLAIFHERMDHPGFGSSETDNTRQALIRYLTSITEEKDPVKREAKLRAYRQQVRESFPT